MKLFVAFVAVVAVAAAVPFKPVTNVEEELEAIVAAIQHPSTDPATAALLEQQLQDLVSAVLPVLPGPVIVDKPVPGPIIVPGPVVVPSPIDVPSPIAVPDPSPSSSPLVQIVVNVRNAADVGVGNIVPTPVQIEEQPAVEEIVPTPIQVVDSAPVPVEPILIAEPINPIPAVILPSPLN